MEGVHLNASLNTEAKSTSAGTGGRGSGAGPGAGCTFIMFARKAPDRAMADESIDCVRALPEAGTVGPNQLGRASSHGAGGNRVDSGA